MQVSNLILEVTRKCNLKCDHCLRGDAQRLVMSDAILFHTIRNFDYISEVAFTGGEPSLAPEVLESFNNLCIQLKIKIGYFYVVTNGMPHNRFQRFLKALNWLYGWVDDKGACCLEMSQDQYHPKDSRSLQQFEVRDEYSGERYGEYLEFFRPDGRKSPITNPINEGRAIETGVGIKDPVIPPEQQRPWQIRRDDSDISIFEESLYISANGNVTSDCNMSFDRIDRESRGNILTTPFSEIIESFSVDEEILLRSVA